MERRTLFAGLTAAVATGGAALAAPPGNIVEAFVAALNAHDIAGFSALFAEDYAQHQDSAAARPPPPGMSAKQATTAYFAARLAALPDLHVVAGPVVLAGDWAAANFAYTGTHTGAPYFGFPPSGRPIAFTTCDILQLRGDLIAAHWGAADIAGLMMQLRA